MQFPQYAVAGVDCLGNGRGGAIHGQAESAGRHQVDDGAVVGGGRIAWVLAGVYILDDRIEVIVFAGIEAGHLIGEVGYVTPVAHDLVGGEDDVEGIVLIHFVPKFIHIPVGTQEGIDHDADVGADAFHFLGIPEGI